MSKEALEESIKHWERLVNCKDWGEINAEGISWEDCALCAKYLDNDCINCPIQIYTGKDFCYGTPYRIVEYLYYSKEHDLANGVTVRSSSFTEIAKDELIFLQTVKLNMYEDGGDALS